MELECLRSDVCLSSAIMCIGVDCDEEALAVATQNVNELELEDSISLILGKVTYNGPPCNGSTISRARGNGGRHGGKKQAKGRGGRQSNRNPPRQDGGATLILNDKDGIPLQDDCVDTVLTNPPFGTKHNAGIDVQFLENSYSIG